MARVSGVFLLVALLLSIVQSVLSISVYAQPTASPGCPGGFVDAILVLRDSLYRLYQLALSFNVSLPGDLVLAVSTAQNLSREALASMPLGECRALYSDLNKALRNIAGALGIYLEPQARGAYERATLRAAERLLERARDLNISDLYGQVLERLRSGNISIGDLEDLDKRVRAREFEAKAERIRAIARGISEDAQYRLKDLSEAAEEITKAEEVLKRVGDLLLSVNASPRAVEAIEQAISIVRKAREAVEEGRGLSEVERVNASISRVENQVRALLNTVNITRLDSAAASKIAGLLEEALRRLSEARERLKAGDIGGALRLLEEAYSLYRKAREAFEDSVKKMGEIEDLLERVRNAMIDVGELKKRLKDIIGMRCVNVTDPHSKTFIERIDAAISEAMNISNNIAELIKAGRLGDARKALEALEERVKEISKTLEELRKGCREDGARAREILEEVGKIRARAAEEYERFKRIAANISNATDQQIRDMIDMIDKAFGELNLALTLLEKEMKLWNVDAAEKLLARAKETLEQITKMLETLENMIRGRR